MPIGCPVFFENTVADAAPEQIRRTTMANTGVKAKVSGATHSATVLVQGANGQEQGILASDLMAGLRGMVPTLGGKKVVVGFSGDGAFVDATLSYVNIPALPPTEVIALSVAREIRGFAAHEAAHVAFTDPEVFPSAIVDDQGNFDKLLKEVWNCVEDFMIEKHWMSLYPGAKKNFAATEARCCKAYLEMHAQNADCAKDLRSVGPVALTWMRSLYFGLGVAASRECFQTMSPGFQARAKGWFRSIVDVETTRDCLDAARIIWKDILSDPIDPLNPPQNPAANPAPPVQGQGQPGQGQPGQGQPGQGQPGQGQPGQGQPGQGQPGQSGVTASPVPGPANGPRGGTHGAPVVHPGNSGPDPISTSANIAAVIAQIRTGEDDNSWLSAEVLSTSTRGPAAKVLGDAAGCARAEQAMGNLRGDAAATSTQLRRSLKAISRNRMKGGRFDGILDSRRAASIATGNTEIYRKKVMGEKIDTAVSVLVDCSSSMSDTIHICRDVALLLEAAFSGTPIRHEIIGFTTADMAHADPSFKIMAQANERAGKKIAARAISLYEFRGFSDSHSKAMQTIGNMVGVPMGMTPTSDAILMAHDRLARRGEARHVMFVLTDGAADSQDRCARAVRSVERCGVSVIGIGIGTNAVGHAFTKSVSIISARDLPALMMSSLTAMLLGEKHKVGMSGRRKDIVRAD